MNNGEEKEISVLAEEFERALEKMPVPKFSSTEFLDLMDYYSRAGMAFESDLCRYFAEKKAPEDIEVKLMKAHIAADDGDWQTANDYVEQIGTGGYDELMFKIEEDVRLCHINSAVFRVKEALPAQLDVHDYDFLLDCAELFYDYGYAFGALLLLDRIPQDYVDYEQAQQLAFECNSVICRDTNAKAVLDKMIDRRPFDDSLWTRMAIMRYRSYDYSGCDDACEYALAINASSEARKLKYYMKFNPEADDVFEEEGVVAALAEQDVSALLHYADLCANNKQYVEAIGLYCQAGLYCPRGHRDREKIVRNIVANSLMEGMEYFPVYDGILAYLVLTGNVWDIAYESAQKIFECGNKKSAVSLLKLALHHKDIKMHQLSLLVLLLHHYECYEEARELWEFVLRHADDVGESLQDYLDEAARKINYDF